MARGLLRGAKRCRQVRIVRRVTNHHPAQERSLAHYPIDDRVNGLTEEQVQLRETIFNFCQKVLSPSDAARASHRLGAGSSR